jgi:anti-anti-sigma regulatory factor
MTEYRQLSIKEIGDVVVVQFLEHCTSDHSEIARLGRELFELANRQNGRKVVFDCGAIERLPREILSCLISFRHKVTARNGVVELCNVPSQVLEILLIIGLDRLFDIKEDKMDAQSAH